jgi:hypothetical protein
MFHGRAEMSGRFLFGAPTASSAILDASAKAADQSGP